MSNQAQVAPVYCQTTLNYADANGITPQLVTIHNARQAAPFHWQTNGFELFQHRSAVTDWRDDAQLAKHYYPEMAALAKELTGCRVAMISGHIARNPEQAKTHEDYAPIEFVHSDFTDNYGELTKERYQLGQAFEMEALATAGITLDELLSAEDLMILQFWRNVGPAQMDRPLAFCDATSVPKQDMHAIHVPNYAGGDFAFDTFAVSPPPVEREHQWYVYPELSVDEVVALRTFDSRRVGTPDPYWTPHSAFVDPTLPKAPARFSIEVRATCLF